jgi:hypothetical protein
VCSIDVDLPIDVDDEYWEHSDPAQAFVQPPGKPSKLSKFVYHLRLHHIINYTMRTVVSFFDIFFDRDPDAIISTLSRNRRRRVMRLATRSGKEKSFRSSIHL